jgi:hypothetical protein
MSHVDQSLGRIVHSANPLGALPGAMPQMKANPRVREQCPDCDEARLVEVATDGHGRLLPDRILEPCRCRRPRPIRRGGRAA